MYGSGAGTDGEITIQQTRQTREVHHPVPFVCRVVAVGSTLQSTVESPAVTALNRAQVTSMLAFG